MTIRVLIADDQGMVRTGFSVFLSAQSDIEVVGEAADGAEAVRKASELAPDVILMDVRMPVLDGLSATRQILAGPVLILMDVRMPVLDGLSATRQILAGPVLDPGGPAAATGQAPKVLVLTTFDLDDYVYEALRAGASGFLLKDASAAQLAEAVRIVARGDALLAPGVTRRLISEFARLGAPRSPSRASLRGLTERETEVLALVAQGLSNTEIATHLVVSEPTVKTHIGRILSKLQLRDRPQAIVYAYEVGLVSAGD